MLDKVRKWCNCQMKCREDSDMTWTCTAHMAEGRAFQCRADCRKVRVNDAGYYCLDGCPDFEPPGYDRNDPDAFGVAKNPKRKKAKKETEL